MAEASGADALPLLAFTLWHLYKDYSAEGTITLGHYDKLGGVRGAIEKALDGALARPGDAPSIPTSKSEQYALLRAAFIPWLVRIDPRTGALTRRRAQLNEIPDSSHAIVKRLENARLLVADRDGKIDVIEVAHESIYRQWKELKAWLDDELTI